MYYIHPDSRLSQVLHLASQQFVSPSGTNIKQASYYTEGSSHIAIHVSLRSFNKFIVLLFKKWRQWKAGKVFFTYQSKDTNPTIRTYRKTRKGKQLKTKRARAALTNKKALALLLKPASPTPSITGSKRLFHRHWEGNKSPAVLRGFAERACISTPMSDQSTACNPHWHILYRQSIIKRMHRVTPDLAQHT